MQDSCNCLPLAAPFIVGAPGSGTTVLRLMLDAHPAIAIPSETHFIPSILRTGIHRRPSPQEFYRIVTDVLWWREFHLDEGKFLEKLQLVRPFNVSEGLRTFYLMYAEQQGKLGWGDKTPSYGLCMLAIQRHLPEAHFIHIVRDGRDIAVTHRNRDKHLCLSELAADWRDSIRETRRQARSCSHYLEMRYEDLINGTQLSLIHVCKFLQLSFCSKMETYFESAPERLSEWGDLRTKSGELIARKEDRLQAFSRTLCPPDPSRIGKFRLSMSKQEVREYESVAGPMLTACGYEVAS